MAVSTPCSSLCFMCLSLAVGFVVVPVVFYLLLLLLLCGFVASCLRAVWHRIVLLVHCCFIMIVLYWINFVVFFYFFLFYLFDVVGVTRVVLVW